MLLENTVRCNIDCIGCDRQSAARIRTTQQMDLEKLSRMADLVHDLRLEQLFYLNLGEPFLSPNIGPGAAAAAAEEPGLPHRHFHQRHRPQHGRQTRGGAQRQPHLFLHCRRERADAQEI